MQEDSDQHLPVATLVRAPQADRSARELIPGIFVSEDVSNSYCVLTDDGAVVINTGTLGGGPTHRRSYDRIMGPAGIRYVIVTQSHTDHYGGLESFSDTGALLVTDKSFPAESQHWRFLRSYYEPRGHRIWRPLLGDRMPVQPEFEVVPDVLVDDHFEFTVGGRRFEVLSTPGGETRDSVCVWLADDKTVFTGNLFGPAFMTVPNLNAIRTDKPRSAAEYLRSISRVLDLEPELLITGHGEPIRGAARIHADLTRMRDAVQYIFDATVAGMNAGQTVHQLMREVTLPAELTISEGYGKVSWAVRTIFEEYTGWFHQDFTSRLYGVPSTASFGDVVELAGADALAARALDHIEAGRVVEGLQLSEVVTTVAPDHAAARDARRRALTLLLQDAENTTGNLNETMWLRSELAAAEAAGGASRDEQPV